ncbi:hypothetical protein HYH02_014084 [Chlamydomonas schloesseri]|uniref:Uncharacterized protein n=1 Tax=Chlamydomonas schloesseri TaxID=2026947 RepID=A0A835SLX0_9CHLO|nr:hypothetical protein HYH02_014084 [Chlamydomonas schloesseri]|eukprot:KAG2429429.1 hypothetical protein HYH02_014084 [Chlamydomonas schloesseri]
MPSQNCMQARIREVLEIFDARRAQLDSPMYDAGYVLDPEFHDHDVSEAMDRFTTVLERMLSPEDAAIAQAQLSVFRGKQGLFGRKSVLKPKRAQDLVYVSSNLRLHRRVLARGYTTNTLEWQDSEESGAEPDA